MWWKLNLQELEKKLNTDFNNGLNKKEVKQRLINYGLNKLPEEKTESFLKIFFDQFKSPLIYILLVSSFIVYLLGDLKDSLIIIFVLIFNALIGSFQEIKAQNTLLSLKKFIETNSSVIRDGKEQIIDSNEIVPGDIIILKEGEKVPADARIIESHNLKVNEASLTGESIPVYKTENIINKENKDLSISEQHNIVFMGTTVVSGNAKVCVFSTGINTFIGKISQKILRIDTEIPLKKNIRNFSRILVSVIFILTTLLFVTGVILGKPIIEMFAIVVALAVSMIPVGLPVLLTVILAKGVLDMAKKNALVKKIQAVESLGQVQIIAVDKTGTITKNELILKKVFINNNLFEISGDGYSPVGDIKLNNEIIKNPIKNFDINLSAKIAIFSSDVIVRFLEKEKVWQVFGDPTDAALLVFGEKVGFKKENIDIEYPIIVEAPFDYQKKYHLVLRKSEKNNFLSVTGAPEAVIDLSSKIYENNKILNFTEQKKYELRKIFEKFSNQGFRVVGFGYKETNKNNFDFDNIIFCGFYLIEDSLRPEVKEAILKIKSFGIKIVMITGDHKLTAISIAREAGIIDKNFKVLTGKEIDEMSEDALTQIVPEINIFSRVTPDHKLKIINAYRKNNIIIAMTGDGVNDVPSLVAADLGIAMGKIGAEVTKESADIILLDDNFRTIIDAIKEGRLIYKNIQKIILFLISTSMGELLSISFSVIFGFPTILKPAQILWLNLVTDPFMGFGLSFEKEGDDILIKKFKTSKYLINKLIIFRMFLIGFTMMSGSVFVFSLFYELDLIKAQTMALLVLSIFQWFNAWNCKSEDESVFKNTFSNKFLILSFFIVFLLQLGAIYLPFMQNILNTKPLSFIEWILSFLIAFSIILVEEARKYIMRFFNFKNNY